ncbi:hypothetical protein [Mucilaginibacter sp. RCC_168]|jgi:hypothetical protein|uniref:hypothetical protein n=1 Tax=unclassified Mucilaginibacter TaxID=2617802 RepID=UPI0035268933
MKKILTLVCCTILLAATSCTKKYVTPGAKTVFTNITADMWHVDNSSAQGSVHGYTVDVPVPDITDYYNDNGAVLAYIDYGDGSYEQIPNVYDNVTFRVTYYTAGHLYIDAQSSTGAVPANPGALKLKLVLVP